MADLEKIIHELENVAAWHTHHYNQFHYECAETIHNALALLKEQENLAGRHKILVEKFDDLLAEMKPHLMTVEDLDALPPGSVVWEEYLDVEWDITELEPAMKLQGENAIMSESGYSKIDEGMGDPDPEGNTFRWWSAKPTEEQRKAAKWK